MIININRRDALWSYLAIFLSMGSSFILVPFILLYLNDDDTAMYYIFSSLSGIAFLFDFGFSPAIARAMTYAWAGANTLKKQGVDKSVSFSPNYTLMQTVIKACKFIYTILALMAFILCITIGTWYISKLTISKSETAHLLSWFVYSMAICLNILYGYYSVFLRGVGAIYEVNLATVISKVIQMFLCIILLILDFGLLGVSFAYLIYGISFRLLAKKWFYDFQCINEKIKSIRCDIPRKDVYNTIFTLWPNVWRDGIVTLSNYILNQSTTIIASLYVSLLETGIYSLALQMVSVVATVSTTLYTAYQPVLQEAYANQNIIKQKKCMSLIMITFFIIFIIGIIGILVIGIPVIEFLKPSYIIGVKIVIGIAIAQFLLKMRNCYTSFISTTNRVIYWDSFVISAIISAILSFLLCGLYNLGIFGIIAAQILSQVLYNAWYWPFKVHKELELSLTDMLRIGIYELVRLIRNRN